MPDMVKISHSIDLGPLPDELIPIARRQGEDPNLVCSYLDELRNIIFGKQFLNEYIFIQTNPFVSERGDFHPDRTDDEFLIKFLRARFFKVENAYKLVCESLLTLHQFNIYFNIIAAHTLSCI